jgi:quinolinate synthase
MPAMEWDAHYDLVAEIDALKRRHNAIVLAHNYQRPEIFHGVADVQGDSLALARHAARSEADVIVMCGVHFMAETAKLLAPDRKVQLPDAMRGRVARSPIRLPPRMYTRSGLVTPEYPWFVT